MAATQSEISLTKKILFSVLILFFVIVILELFLYVLLKLTLDQYSYTTLIETRKAIVEENSDSVINSPSLVALHPYLGFVYDPTKKNSRQTNRRWGLPISDYGFIDDGDPLIRGKNDTIVIGIFGGSVAFQFSAMGVDALVRQLQTSSLFKNKNIDIVRVALGGYKQPQQLMALTYFLSLGAEFDIVINLDGFNEVALPPKQNIPRGVSPTYPRSWHWQLDPLMSNKTKSIVGRMSFLRDTRIYFASLVNDSWLRFSNTANTLWMASDGVLGRALGKMQRELSTSTDERSKGYERSGPKYTYEDDPTMYRDLASYWSMASQQMAKLAEANQILYWHFLQPNQYVPDSKTFSEEEMEIAFNPESPYKKHAQQGYLALVETGNEMSKSNSRFHDLTMVFKEEAVSVYSDDCCHLNEHGNEILGATIGRLMLEDIEKHGIYPRFRNQSAE